MSANPDVTPGALQSVATLPDEALLKAHERAHLHTPDTPGMLVVHHAVCAEMTKRGLSHGHESGDEWAARTVVVDSRRVDLTKAEDAADLPMPLAAALRSAYDKGQGFAEVLMTLGVNGYELRLVPGDREQSTGEQVLSEMLAPGSGDSLPDVGEPCEACADGCDCEPGACDCPDTCGCPECAHTGALSPEDAMDADEGADEYGEDEDDSEGFLARLIVGVAASLGMVEKGYSFDHENALIARNRKRKSAQGQHEFKAARWKTRDGRERCVMCGKARPDMGVMCNAAPQMHLITKADTYTPPKGVQAAGQRALEWIADGKAGDGFTDVGRKRASQLANGDAVSEDTIRRMANYFSRHTPDTKATGFNAGEDGFPSPGRVAWDAWGGDPGKAWAQSIVDRLNAAEKAHGPHKFKSPDEGVNCAVCQQPQDSWRHDIAKSLGEWGVSKANEEQRYTLAPMYIPDTLDAHSEWTDANELQQAVWEYVRSGDRAIRLQHNREVVAGEWVEIMSFPFALKAPLTLPDGTVQEYEFPADTVFLGVVWEPWAWALVQAGKVRGYSIGGKAKRVMVDIPDAEQDVSKDDPTVGDVHIDTATWAYPKGKKPKKVGY